MATGSHDDPTPSTGVEIAVEASLASCLEQYLQPEEREQVSRALACAGTANPPYRGTGGRAQSLDDTMRVVTLLAETARAGPVTLAAALLYPSFVRGALNPETMATCLGPEFAQEVRALIEGMRALSLSERWDPTRKPSEEATTDEGDGAPGSQEQGARKRERKQRRKRHAELLRDLLLLAREEPRIAAWKLAERLHLMDEVRTTAARLRRETQTGGPDEGILAVPGSLTLDECTAIAVETRESYAPVASHLGMRRLEAKLHDHAFAVLQPDEYQRLSVALAAHTEGWQPYLDGVRTALSQHLQELGIEAEVFFRRKTVYSIHQKLKRLDSTNPGDLYDLLAVRIITENVEACYLALDVVHALWPPVEGRVKDYIAAPKKNGYRSLHTTVRSVDARTVEIQIRARQMHVLAEYGMHWLYKTRGDTDALSLEESEELAAAVLQHQERIRQAYQPTAPDADETPHDHLHVYTPDGLLKTLPRGATVLDFAFYVHMEVGWHASGAQVIAVGGVKKPIALDHPLQGGETVEILTRDEVHPMYAWLSRVQTKKARGEIIRYLRTHNREADLELLGRERVDDELRGLGVAGGLESLSAEDRAWLARQLQQSSLSALLVAVASEKIELSNVSALLRSRLKVRLPSSQAWRVRKPAAEASSEPSEMAELVAPARLDGILTRLANCCHPLPSDALLGYITRGSGIAIHRADCPNIPYLRGRFPERVVAVEWPAGEQMGGLRVHLIVEGREGADILREVMATLERHHVTVVQVEVGERHRSQRSVLDLTLELHQLAQLNRVLGDLRAAPEVLFADRRRPHVD